MSKQTEPPPIAVAAPFLVLLVVIATIFVAATTVPDVRAQERNARRAASPFITISRETTYLTGPLTADGYVDYVAALDEQARQGVTTENNAAVLLWQACGPASVLTGERDELFERLGIPCPPDEGRYFVCWGDWQFREYQRTGSRPDFTEPDLLAQAMTVPWSSRDLPRVARWLRVNEEPMRLLREGSRRERYYSPLLGSRVLAQSHWDSFRVYQVVQAFTARSMLRLGEGRVEAAWDDLFTAHRWGRLMGQQPILSPTLMSFVAERYACDTHAALARHGSLSMEEAARYREELRRLPPIPSLATVFDINQRFIFLETVVALERRDLKWIEGLGQLISGEVEAPISWFDRLLHDADIDWDEVLRAGNQWYDRIVAARRQPTIAERRQAFEALEADKRRMRRQTIRLQRRPLPANRTRALTRFLLASWIVELENVWDGEDRVRTRQDLVQLAYALAGYRHRHGDWPETLSSLVPEFIDKLPSDPYTGREFIYRSTETGYRLYSVGENGQDDGGRTFDSSPQGDDIVLSGTTEPTVIKRKKAPRPTTNN